MPPCLLLRAISSVLFNSYSLLRALCKEEFEERVLLSGRVFSFKFSTADIVLTWTPETIRHCMDLLVGLHVKLPLVKLARSL